MTVIDEYLVDEQRDVLFLQNWLPIINGNTKPVIHDGVAVSLLRELYADVYMCGPHYPAFLRTLPHLCDLIDAAFNDPTQPIIRELYELSEAYGNLHGTEGPIASINNKAEYIELTAGGNQIVPNQGIWGSVPQTNTPPWPNVHAGDVQVYLREAGLKYDPRAFAEVIIDYFSAYITQHLLAQAPETHAFHILFQRFLNRWDLDI